MTELPTNPREEPAATVDALERKVARESDPIPEYDEPAEGATEAATEDRAPGTPSPEPPD